MADPAEETVNAAPPPTPAAPAEGGSAPPLPAEPPTEAKAAASPEKATPPAPAPDTTARSRGFRLLGEDTSVHKALGGGKTADVLLWKDKKTTAVVIGGTTVMWILFEVLDYHLLTLISHVTIAVLAILFLWSKATTFIKKSPPDIPVVQIPEDVAVNVVRAFRNDVNRALHLFREIAMGHDLKKFLGLIAALWVLSEVGSCCDFLTLIYVAVLMLHTRSCMTSTRTRWITLLGRPIQRPASIMRCWRPRFSARYPGVRRKPRSRPRMLMSCA